MIVLKEILTETKVQQLSPQEAREKKLFGPVYHGTTEDNRQEIDASGFKVFYGNERSGNITHGYEVSDYWGGMPAPIHHLGFGIYFTTVLSIAKQYNYGTARGLKVYFLDVPRLETINFGAPRTMMKWWVENGYDYKVTPGTTFGGTRTDFGGTKNTLPAIRDERYRATVHLTEELKKKYDAVWFKGKGMYRLLDGDQVCVYDVNNIFEMNPKLAKPGEIGSKVVAIQGIDPYGRGEIVVPQGTRGVILHRTNAEQMRQDFPLNSMAKVANQYLYDIHWKKGGKVSQIPDAWVQLV